MRTTDKLLRDSPRFYSGSIPVTALTASFIKQKAKCPQKQHHLHTGDHATSASEQCLLPAQQGSSLRVVADVWIM